MAEQNVRKRLPLVIDTVRLVIDFCAVVVFGFWGFAQWDLPWNIVVGIGAPLVAIFIWALFLSPRAVLRMELYARSLVEIVFYAAAALALWTLGLPVVALVFLCVAVAFGLWNGLTRLEHSSRS